MIFVVAPLSIYLIIILFTLKDIEPSGMPAAQAAPNEPDTAPLPDASTAQLIAPASPVISPNEITPDTKADAIQLSNTAEHILPARPSSTAERIRTTEPPADVPSPAVETTLPVTASTEIAPALSAEQTIAPTKEQLATPTADQLAAPAVSMEIAPDQTVQTASVPPVPEIGSSTLDKSIITEPVNAQPEDSEEIGTGEEEIPDGPLQFPKKGSPRFAFDYRGRLWVEKKNKGFFKQLRRPQLPPDEPGSR